MTTYERLEEIKNAVNLTAENARDAYQKAENEIANLIGSYVIGAEVSCQAHGSGHIVAYKGTALDNIIVDVEFADIIKKFSLKHIITVAKFIRFEDIFEIVSIWDEAYAIHNELTEQYTTFERQAKQLALEAKKKAEEEKKATAKYEKAKAKAIADFTELAEAERPISTADEFYYSLGWLTKNATSFSAAMPDYLQTSFENHFGTDYKPTVVDSKKKTINGYAMQWALSMKAAISKKAVDLIPSYLTKHLSASGNAISDTSFIWDLVDNYGFKFGKKQDVDKIRSKVPSDYIDSFELGLA